MAGMQFEYDEKGGTFYYFLLSFLALILVPVTYWLWPRGEVKEDPEKQKKQCHCEPCQVKKQRLKADKPWQTFKRRAIKFGIIVAWLFVLYLAHKTTQVELDWTEFDPYQELGIDRGASDREIKKAYRKLSLIYHPDKDTGDSHKFMRISKAHQALTNEEARDNWEKYGNPDGPGAAHFGIALPKWIVEKQNSVWVLAVYGLVFMIILPVVVGTWWYRSIKYSPEQILMDTTQLYFYFFNKTPNMILRRVLMILAGSMEFEKGHNNEISERPSDNEEIPLLMRDLPQLNEKKKERPLCYPYSIKARALVHAHCSRLELPPKSLEIDKIYILKKCPYLLNEMVNIVAQLVAMAHAGRVQREPRLETIENIMKLSQMIVQALWDTKSPLLQLPHIREDLLKHFNTRRRRVRSIRQFACLPEDERRALLRNLVDDEYRDIMNVCASMPDISMDVRTEVLDDDDKTITAGSIVTVTVSMERRGLDSLMDRDFQAEEAAAAKAEEEREEEEEQPEEQSALKALESPAHKPKVWEKQKKKKGKGGKPKKKPAKPQVNLVKKPAQTLTSSATSGQDNKKEEEGDQERTPNGSIPKSKRTRDNSGSKEENSASESGSENDSDLEADPEVEEEEKRAAGHEDDDDEAWQKFQDEAKKDSPLEAKSKETHVVHSPYFPAVKHEWWWVYVSDAKRHMLVTAPVQVCSLKQHEEIQLKFSAPPKPGIYTYTVNLRSDSYLDFDQAQNIKLDVKEAKKVESHPQWEIEDDEDKENDDETGSELSTDYEESDED